MTLWKGATYCLDADECAAVQHEACRRQNRSKHGGYEYRNWSSIDPFTHECNSVGAEIALASLTGGWWMPIPDDVPLNGLPDVYLRDGRTIDAKQTHHENGRLHLSTRAGGKADLYVLLIGVMPFYEFRGWATSEELRRPCNIEPQWDGTCYALGRLCLHESLELP